MMLATTRRAAARRSGFTLIEVLVVVAILVILATIAAVAVPKQIDEAKKSKAQIGCVTLSRAVQSYQISASNPGQADEDRLPSGPGDLVSPPWGGTSFLPEGQSSLLDPWGKQYQFERQTKNDGTLYILVHTTAQDGTQISQFGIGPNAQPKN